MGPEGRDPVDAGPGGAGRGARQRGGQEVAAREPRARRDRVHARLRAALRRQAGVPRALQALAGGGHRCARQRGLPQGDVFLSFLVVPPELTSIFRFDTCVLVIGTVLLIPANLRRISECGLYL